MKTKMIGVIVMLVVLGSTTNQAAVLADYESCFKKCVGSCPFSNPKLCNTYCSIRCQSSTELPLQKPKNLATTNGDSDSTP
ncbi:unnamed protein product [Linum trigynum]|uniref:Plant thionin family protein n=1 Tax=Linum trigynum TaxID=586398 RepID=A0AAV2EIZ1_9ROSI